MTDKETLAKITARLKGQSVIEDVLVNGQRTTQRAAPLNGFTFFHGCGYKSEEARSQALDEACALARAADGVEPLVLCYDYDRKL